jgi:lipopolysaccharide biosynthesis regulator YciM
MTSLLWLLLPVAAASGWFAARRAGSRQSSPPCADLSRDYFRGLNYLINDQPDKAVEVLSRALEGEPAAADLHITLGNLFRRRGEVDRAIRLHQSVLNRSDLTAEQRSQSSLELGHDYLRAGLLDRAENLLLSLVDDPDWGAAALDYLIVVYQQEREWQKAAATAQRLQQYSGESMAAAIGHYYCELADEAVRKRDTLAAQGFLAHALAVDPQCVRASILEAQLAREESDLEKAIAALRRVPDQDPAYLGEVLSPLAGFYHRLGRMEEWTRYLDELMRKRPTLKAALMRTELIEREHGRQDAIIFLVNYLSNSPSLRALRQLMDLAASETSGELKDTLRVMRTTIERVADRVPQYKCVQCGFAGRSLHWQCPSCKAWGSVKPVETLMQEWGR